MRTFTLVAVATLALAGVAHAAPVAPTPVLPPPGPAEVCGAPNGISHVSTQPASCCADLPCQRPLSFGEVEARRHATRT